VSLDLSLGAKYSRRNALLGDCAAGGQHKQTEGKSDEKMRIVTRDTPFLKGGFTPLVVPFKSGAVDYDQYAELIEWQIEQGMHGLLVNATSGEPTTLTREEKTRLIQVAVETSARRRPVVAGIPAESHAESGDASCRG
jgi:Dihydrodipicolinate synthetase family